MDDIEIAHGNPYHGIIPRKTSTVATFLTEIRICEIPKSQDMRLINALKKYVCTRPLDPFWASVSIMRLLNYEEYLNLQIFQVNFCKIVIYAYKRSPGNAGASA